MSMFPFKFFIGVLGQVNFTRMPETINSGNLPSDN